MICPQCGHKFVKVISDDEKKYALMLRKEGLTVREIAGLVGISFPSVARILRRNEDERVRAKSKLKTRRKL